MILRNLKGILFFWLFSSTHAMALEAFELQLHFWPTTVIQRDPFSTGTLFSWPEFKVLLQTKNSSTYTPATLGAVLASQLTALFAPKPGSAVEIIHDEANATWGLAIKGGSLLRQENLELLEPMVQSFISCLSTLSEEQVDRMKEVIYAPHLSLSLNGELAISEEQKKIVSQMYASYERNRCQGGSTKIHDLVRNKSRQYLSAMLRGQSRNLEVTDADLLVLTTLFKNLLFAPNGLWVRSVLAKIQELVTERMKAFPALRDSNWLKRDYESFIDFVLLTKNQEELNKQQYIDIAKACGIEDVGEVFKPFSPKQCLMSNQLVTLHLHLGSTVSTHYLKGGRE